MNEQIRELMEYAVRFRLDPDSNAYEAQVQPENLELFAELIVRECAQFVEDNFDFVGDEIIVKEKMLEYFGVEQDSEE